MVRTRNGNNSYLDEIIKIKKQSEQATLQCKICDFSLENTYLNYE